SYNARSRYHVDEKAFKVSHEIYSRIGNELGAANVLAGLGESYNARSRYQEAEKLFAASHEIHSRIGNHLGAANALAGLGENYNTQSRNQEADTAFKEAYDIHSRIGNNLGVANALMGLGEISTAQLKYEEAKNAFKQARGIYSRTGSQVGRARAGILLYETYNAQLNSSEADKALKDASEILFLLENKISPKNVPNHPEEDCDTPSIYSGDDEAKEDRLRIEHNVKEANAPEEDSASFSVADTQPNGRRQEQDLSKQLTAIAHAPVPATNELIDLLQALGKAAPKAVRNKHKIYSILRVSRDICNHIMEIGDPHERQSDSNIKVILTRAEDYFELLDALEEGIRPGISAQFMDVPGTHPAFVVVKGLEYLETQVKCGVPDEPTRELIIDIATLLALTLTSASPDDGDKSPQKDDPLATEADREWLFQALAE
ncbi:hypothetical protein FS837_003539, partial [Tulasnella sp. UAMH 9824]